MTVMSSSMLRIDFRDVFDALTKGIHNEGVEYHLHNNLLYHVGKICISKDERVDVIW